MHEKLYTDAFFIAEILHKEGESTNINKRVIIASLYMVATISVNDLEQK